MLSGGGDLDPAGYGAGPHPLTTRVYPERDRAERALLGAALADGRAGPGHLPRPADT